MQYTPTFNEAERIIRMLETAKYEMDQSLDMIPGLFIVTDPEGNILRGNQGASNLFDIELEKIHTCNLSELFTEADWSNFVSLLDKALHEPGKIFRYEKTLKLRHHSKDFLLDIFSQKRQSERSIRMITIIGQDISEVKNLAAKNSRMSMELEAGQLVQSRLLPRVDGKIDQCRINGYYEAASECGGDWWFYSKIGDFAILAIGDVTGHGIPAALITSALTATATIIEKMKIVDLFDMAELLNQVILNTAKGGSFVTGVLSRVHLKTGEAELLYFGHPPVLLIPAKQEGEPQESIMIKFTNPSGPLGAEENIRPWKNHCRLEPGDRLFFYTDGVIELMSEEDREYRMRGLLKTSMESLNQGRNRDLFIGDISKSLRNFRGRRLPDDDITYFCFEFNPS